MNSSQNYGDFKIIFRLKHFWIKPQTVDRVSWIRSVVKWYQWTFQSKPIMLKDINDHVLGNYALSVIIPTMKFQYFTSVWQSIMKRLRVALSSKDHNCTITWMTSREQNTLSNHHSLTSYEVGVLSGQKSVRDTFIWKLFCEALFIFECLCKYLNDWKLYITVSPSKRIAHNTQKQILQMSLILTDDM